MRRAVTRWLAGVAVLAALAGTAGAALVALAPIPARAAARMALLRNGAARGFDAGNSPVWILALGSDARPGEDVFHQRADSIHLIGINPASGAGTILGIPRDSYVHIPGVGTDKINAALTYGGPPLVADTVEELTGIHAQYIFLTTFDGLTRMVDRLGGVTVDVDQSMHDADSGADFEPGPQLLAGGQALAFSRDRHDVSGGDFGRSKHQGDLLLATLAQVKEQAKAEGALPLVLNFLLDDTYTDVAPPDVYRLGRLAMTVEPGAVQNIVAPGGTGTAGTASIVVLDLGGLAAIGADIKDDAVLNG